MPVFKFLPVAPNDVPPQGGSALLLGLLPLSLDDLRVTGGALTLLSDITDPANSYAISFKGSGFVTSFDGAAYDVSKGTITSISARNLDGDVILQASGLDLSAKTLFNLIDAGDLLPLLNYIMQTNDRVDGSRYDDTLAGMAGRDTIFGFGGDDSLIGFDGNDRIFGAKQGDSLVGGTGADSLFGGAGADEMSGDEGKDVLSGGGGGDAFVFNSALLASNIDRISDFQAGLDHIALDNDIFTAAGAVGDLSAAAFHVGAAAADLSDRIIYTKSTGVISYDANGSLAGDAIAFARVTPGLTLTFADFAIVE